MLALPAAAQDAAPDAATTSADTPATAPAAAAPADVYDTISLPATPSAAPVAPRNAATSGIAEVIVTARRTAEHLQDVPVAISTLNAGHLQRDRKSLVHGEGVA